MPSRFERAPEVALVRHPEEGRGLDPQWETTQSLSKRCRSPDRLTFRIWRMAEQSKPMPCGTIGVQSRAGEPCRFTILLVYRIGFEPMSSTFGGSRSSAELSVIIA